MILTGYTRAAKHGPSSGLVLGALYEERGRSFRRKMIWHCSCAFGTHGDQAGHVWPKEARECAQAELRRRFRAAS